MESERDAFHTAHQLIGRKLWSKVLSEICDSGSGRIRSKYTEDRNHAWYLVGDAMYKMKQYAGAAKAFRNAIRNRPDDHQAMMAIANCYSELGLPRWSVHYLREATALQPKNAELLFNLGNAYFDKRDFDLAIGAYKKARKHADQSLIEKCDRNTALAMKNR